VIVDSTGPSVSLADPGTVVSGSVALSASTGGGAVNVVFGLCCRRRDVDVCRLRHDRAVRHVV